MTDTSVHQRHNLGSANIQPILTRYQLEFLNARQLTGRMGLVWHLAIAFSILGKWDFELASKILCWKEDRIQRQLGYIAIYRRIRHCQTSVKEKVDRDRRQDKRPQHTSVLWQSIRRVNHKREGTCVL